jgi:molybdopterin molybdotransferase
MISVKEAKNILEQNAHKGKPATIELSKSVGMILAKNVVAPIDVPSFDNSAMDGYAIRFDDSRSGWNIKAIAQAGDSRTYYINSDEAVRIFTGAKMPENTDTVIQQELIESGQGNSISLLQSGIKKGANVRYKGSQCKKGDPVLVEGTKISPGTIGLLATMGIDVVEVYNTPSVACIITGNELQEIGETLQDGSIYNSNGPMLQAYLNSLGIIDSSFYKAKDDSEHLYELIKKALNDHDFLILSGGISVGDYDFVKLSLDRLNVEELFYKIKQRPGKPLFAGKLDGKWIFALPGNPASVLTCFNQYVKPCLKYFMGHQEVWNHNWMLPLTASAQKKEGFTFFMKGLHDGRSVTILQGQQSFNMLPFGVANCLVELEEGLSSVPAESLVKVYDLV